MTNGKNKLKFNPPESIIIICEGSTTEYLYFKDLKRTLMAAGKIRDHELRILPEVHELTRQHSGRQPRNLMGDSSKWRYYEKEESSEEEYNKYKKQPLRYLREAQLFCDEGTYAEGWAVYDKDHHPAHDYVDEMLSDSRLHVAFSAYSFEAWMLAHFEYNTTAYMHSECKDSEGKECRCGHKDANPDNDCHGEICLGGILRAKKYIPNYSKKDNTLFSTYTINSRGEINDKALINAARLQMNYGEQRFIAEAYTDVDKLVCKLMGKDNEFIWKKTEEAFTLGRTEIIVHIHCNNLWIENIDERNPLLITYNNLFFCNQYGTNKASVFNKNIYLQPGQFSPSVPIERHQFVILEMPEMNILLELQ